MKSKFDLNIEKILDNWEIYHAVREIISNALDEMTLTNTKMVDIYKVGKEWHIRDYGRGIRYENLTQNVNKEKKNSSQVIGRFGVGLKDALAVFYKNKIRVKISSRYNCIGLDMCTKSDFENIKTLHAIITDPEDKNMVGTDVAIEADDNDIELAKSLFLIFNNNHENNGDGEVKP